MEYQSLKGFPLANPNYLSTRNGKYRNINLVSPNDAGYQERTRQIINAKRSKRSIDYVPVEVPALQKISGDIEHVVRNSFFGSEVCRIVEYEVRVDGKYIKLYHEIDALRVETDGAITLVEIKAKSSINTFKALNQLKRSAVILNHKYNKLNLVVINVDMASLTGQSDLLHGSALNKDTLKFTDEGVGYYSFILSSEDIRQLAAGNDCFKQSIFELACVEAKFLATQRLLKYQERAQCKIEQLAIMENMPTIFATKFQASLA